MQRFKLEFKIEWYLNIQLLQHITSATEKVHTITHQLAIGTIDTLDTESLRNYEHDA